MIIDVLVYKVYLYDNHLTTIYTIQNKNGERVTKDIPLIEEIENIFKNQESSFLDDYAEPFNRLVIASLLFFYFCAKTLVLHIKN